MQNRWDEAAAREAVETYREQGVPEELALRVYSSRLIGRDPALVLHGGGNTSVKGTGRGPTGAEVAVLYVKGSGWDLASIEPPGFPAVRLEPIRALRQVEHLSDEEMVNALRTNLLDASAPNPSVEALLHAFLPHRFVDHTHADAVLALVDQPDPEARCAEVFGERLAEGLYLMEDLGAYNLAENLAQWRREPGGGARAAKALKAVVRWLAAFQVRGGEALDVLLPPGAAELDGTVFRGDIQRFLNHFLPRFVLLPAPVTPSVQSDLDALADRLDALPREHFCYRDFQTRNIMWCDKGARDGPVFLDYQS
ncbi:MAG: class II aldolase/adducin family protein, partial [SAR324 cluster bacterium]|nr:class II aldolase/adducin family protein [SAR324 cluster bacterium]